jgi:hypothetical protein
LLPYKPDFPHFDNPGSKIMKRTIVLVLAALAAAAPIAVTSTSAEAQVPPRYGAWGDRDRDGIPNAYDRHDNRYDQRNYNRYGAWGDRDHDGIPNAYDRYDNRRALRDRDHDGVPQAWDRNDRNPWRQ